MKSNTAMKLLRANLDDPNGRNPQIVDGFDYSDFEDLLGALGGPPPGAKTAAGLAAELKAGYSTVTRRLKLAVKTGRMESGKFRDVDGKGRSIYYWAKNK